MKKFEHGGNIHKACREGARSGLQILDFSANINPLGPPEWLRPLISSELEQIFHYPDPENLQICSAIAEYFHVSTEHIVIGNGTTELLYALMRSLPCERVVIPVPSYVDYVRAAEIAGKTVSFFYLEEERAFQLDVARLQQELRPGDLVFIAVPNNPTGKIPDRKELLALIKACPQSIFLFDEAFLDFIEDYPSFCCAGENVVTLNSMTKFYAIPGLRLGFATMPTAFARNLKDILPPWTVNTLAQLVGERAVQDREYQKKSISACRQLRCELTAQLKSLPGLQVFESTVNYLLIKLQSEKTSTLKEHCEKAGILIRSCHNYNGITAPDSFFRVAVKNSSENQRLVECLSSFFKIKKRQGSKKKTPSIMFQGTCSDAGKSILTTALCRIMMQDGFAIAPFKAQNMSLNSFVTLQGDEMGRAQVVQAQAAKLDPDCRMNPILLKPNSDTGSQVIVNGQPVGNMAVSQYNAYKSQVWPEVCRAYDRLAADFDAIILEGAGSPGEVNLKKDDIVNMRMAEYAEAPVILVGDIDRGGVYASFVGIMEVLSEWERNLVAGFVVNKFRGQESLLASAHDYLKLHTKRPVLGVIPYIKKMGIPEEDSVSFKKGSFNTTSKEESVEIAVINLPHISNFTDVEPFLEEPDVTLRIVENISELRSPDAIIIPGSKNVINDLRFLYQSGLAEAITRQLEKGCEIVGICGGYQMLGQKISDPYQIESSVIDKEGLRAMGLLPMNTILEERKNLTRKSGLHLGSGKKVVGYEIHHGISTGVQDIVLQFDDSSFCGSTSSDHKVWGAYLHGIFDSDEFRRWFIDKLRTRKGLQPVGRIVAPYDLEASFDQLADVVRQAIDIQQLYKLMKI
jgi:cobyric acid synthase CobQ/L-threonine-O-3-phosphate decarboxylase